MSPSHPFRGTGVALVTPFGADGAVDHEALDRLIDHVLADGGVDYLVSLGTTGESATLDAAEKAAVLRRTVARAAGRKPVVAGFGGNDTRAVVEAIAAQDFAGIAGILSVSPYYNKPTQEGIYRHYMAIDEAAPVPVILYNVPGRTGSNVQAATTLRLARDGRRIAAVKEASGDFGQIGAILAGRPQGFAVLSGDDALTLPQLALGIDGVISVVANAWPRMFAGMVRRALDGDYATARGAHFRLAEAMDLLFAEGNPGGVKAALAAMGLMGEHLRLPCHPVSDALRGRIAAAVAALA